MSVFVDHQYLSTHNPCDPIGFLVGNANGLVLVLLDHRAEDCRLAFTTAEWGEFCRLKNEMQKLFLAAEARLAPAPTFFGLNRNPSNTPTQLPPPPPTGFSCGRCQTFNEYAAPNQADGTYLCYGCRP